jgi:hypothetical protein
MRLLLGSRQSILILCRHCLVNAVGIETTILAGRAASRYHRCHGAEHCRGAVPCREATRAQEAACSQSRGSQRMPPKSLSAKSKASVALSGTLIFLSGKSVGSALGANASRPAAARAGGFFVAVWAPADDFGRAALLIAASRHWGAGQPLTANATNSAGDERHRFEISHDTARPRRPLCPGGLNRSPQHFISEGKVECGMEQRFHRGFTVAGKPELWDRWKRLL